MLAISKLLGRLRFICGLLKNNGIETDARKNVRSRAGETFKLKHDVKSMRPCYAFLELSRTAWSSIVLPRPRSMSPRSGRRHKRNLASKLIPFATRNRMKESAQRTAA